MRSPGRYVSRGVCSRDGRMRLGAAEVDDDVVAALEATHDAGDELAPAVLELVEDDVALGVADALDDDLLGRLRGDAAEALALLRELEQVAELLVLLARALGVFVEVEDLEAELLAELGLEAVALGVDGADLALVVVDLLDDGHVLEEIDGAGLLVEARLELAVDAERRLAAVRIACSIVSTRIAELMPFSLLTWSMMLCSESVPCCMGFHL